MLSCTRCLVAGATIHGRFSTLLTVPTETPARCATSLMLGVAIVPRPAVVTSAAVYPALD